MATKDVTPTDLSTNQVGQVDHLLSQIASLSHSIDCLAIKISGDEDESDMSVAISAMATQIQFLAELAKEKLGSPVKPNAVDYLTSPAYLELEPGVMQ